MVRKILVIAAHPDDEVLGCGGTILKHKENGDIVNILIVSEGETSRIHSQNNKQISSLISNRKKSSNEVSKILKIDSYEFLDFPDNRLDSVNLLDLIKKIEKKISEFEPDILYTHHHGDLNIDHKLINEAVVTACRPITNKNVEKIFTFEIPSSTDWQLGKENSSFNPNYFVNIADQLDKKLEALMAYKSELRKWPHSRSLKGIKSQAYIRGMQSGFLASEAFVLLRELVF